MSLSTQLKQRARALKADTLALYFAARHPRTPWYAKLLALFVATYAFSPIDLIPDFIPVLGYLDDVILVPLGIALTLRLVPDEVMIECRERAGDVAQRRVSWPAALAIVMVWLAIALLGAHWLYRRLQS